MWSVFFVACTGEPAVVTPAPEAAPAPAPSPGPSADAEESDPPTFQGTTGIVDKPFTGTATTRLEKVHVKARKGFERAAFEFSGALPGYHVEYVDKSAVVGCGSGEPMAVAGDAWLAVRFTPSAAHTEEGQSTVGFQELKPDGTKAMRALGQTCDFEGVVAWAIGLSSSRPYRVTEKQDPPRLFVDVEQ